MNKKNIIYIIEGTTRVRGGHNQEFLGAALDREQAFKVCRDQSKRELFETFTLTQYNLTTNQPVGSGETVWPYQEYTDDGHLTPVSKRVDGQCLQGMWGPYCAECRKIFSLELSKKLAPLKK
jgi:hypothetical protein